MTQATLFPSDPETVPYPGEPAVWFQRVVILHARRTGVEPIRNIEFRRGLNVVNTKRTKDPESTAFGHNVGKTLLIRMLRYALGDEHLASVRVRSRIRERITDGTLLAVVRVQGTTWCVARSLFHPRQSFCLQSENWQDMLVESSVLRPFAEFQSALDRLLPTEFNSIRVARGRRQPTWTDLVGWLIRDQHCRYISHNTWRFKEDESDPDILLDSEANLIARVVLRLFDRKEYELTDQLDQLRSQVRKLQTELIQIRQDRERAARFIIDEAGLPEELTEDDLHQASIKGQIEEQRKTHEEALERLPEALALSESEKQLVDRRSERDKIGGRLEQLDMDLQRVKGALALAETPDQAEALAERRKSLSCGLEGCLHLTSTSLPPDPTRQDRIQSHQEELRWVENEITVTTADLDQKQAAVRDAESTEKVAKEKHKQAAAESTQNIARCDLLLGRLKLFAASLAKENTAESKRQGTDDRIKEIEQQREARANTRKRQMKRLNDAFHEVTNGLIRRPTGNLSLDLRSGLVPNPDASSGEAFGSAGHVVGFDLTCLSASINGHASQPRLLVHDSPREADLHEFVYRNLFRYVLSLEARFLGQEPAFQYIITTTSPPPEIVKPEHIRETLDDETPSGRLLGFEF